MQGAAVRVEGVFDLSADDVFPPVDAVHVDVLQHVHAVARTGSDLGGCAGRIQPQGQGGMPQVIWATSERRSGQFRAERYLAGGAPDSP